LKETPVLETDKNAATTPRSVRRPSLAPEDRFARVVEASPAALVLVGRTRRIEMVNRQAERTFGYDRAELQGKPMEMLFPQRFFHDHSGPDSDFITNLAPLMFAEGRSLFGLKKDGSEFPLKIGINPIDIDGEPMMLAAIIDFTARSEIEHEHEQHRCELARSNADLEEFAYAASHDLKAPLRAISHLAQWIGDDVAATATAETQQNLKLLHGRVARMQMLLDGLLAYSCVGQTKGAIENVDTAEVVRDITEMLGPPPGFTVACDGPMPVIHTHRVAIRVVLENLISNALNHHDRSQGHVTVSARPLQGGNEFRVSDDGPGIAPEFHERIFLIFQTLASRDEVESSGIGLAIVKKKVENHGGTIWVESAPPARGSTFVFTWK
jgi:PAS domain S-box-containing protein